MDTHTLNDRDVPLSPSRPGRLRRVLRMGRRTASPTATPSPSPSPSPSPRRGVPAGRPRAVPVLDGDEIAPVPMRLAQVGVWAERTVGQWPLAAPLLVSGYFTYHVGTDGLNLPPWVAFCLTSALEGGLWKLVRIAHRTLLLGDSTATIRAGVAVYVAAISGIIYWHAAETGADWRPAAAVAGMSALGVYIAGRSTRLARRVQLHARGLVDAQMPKFSVGSWLFHGIETFLALRHAVRYRIEAPDHAFADRAAFIAAGRPGVRVFLRRHAGTWTPIAWGEDGDDEDDWSDYETVPVSVGTHIRKRPAVSPSPSRAASPSSGRALSPSPSPSAAASPSPSGGDTGRPSPSRALAASPGTALVVSPSSPSRPSRSGGDNDTRSRAEVWRDMGENGDARRDRVTAVSGVYRDWETGGYFPTVREVKAITSPEVNSLNVASKTHGDMIALRAARFRDEVPATAEAFADDVQ